MLKYKLKKRKAKLNGKIELIVLVKQWIHQGFTYLDKTEMFYRLIWEIIPFILIFSIFDLFVENLYFNLVLSIIITHTINWIFNFNFWTCMCFTFPRIVNPGQQKTIKYLQDMQNRLRKYDSISGCMLYGSITRNKWHIKSDLDMRILRKPGIFNGFKAYLVVFTERIIAVSKKQPLDLYLADTIKFLDKINTNEYPIFLINNDNRLFEKYQSKSEIKFEDVTDLNQISIK